MPDMKHLFLPFAFSFAAFFLSFIPLNGQVLPPPEVSETFIVRSVQYEGMVSDIPHSAWPCTEIRLTPKTVQIGRKVLEIKGSHSFSDGTTYILFDGQSDSEMIIRKRSLYGIYVIEFSGYTFKCALKSDEVSNEDASLPDEHAAGVNESEAKAAPFTLVEEKPSFMGGDANQFSKWVNERLVYPESAKKKGVQGRLTLQFTVEDDGRVTNVRVLQGVDPDLDAEAVRVVSSSPNWKPGKNKDKPVRVSYTFPVVFQCR